jgi:peptide/nickel transport system ATP-binding protein
MGLSSGLPMALAAARHRTQIDPMSDAPRTFLKVNDLTVSFSGISALRGVNIDIETGETLGFVGESGSGKTLTWLAALGLLGPAARVEGSVSLDGEELLGAAPRRLDKLRGRRIAMVFQDATGALNPMRSVGWQVAEVLRLHRGLSGRSVRAETRRLFDLVGMPDPARRIDAYPHELSGGQNQRAMIAMALAGQPDLLIADEPTTALDATIQAQILELLRRIQRETGMAMVLISHDLAVVAELCDRVAVMYAGQIVEYASAKAVFAHPAHPYTSGLLNALPALEGPKRQLKPIRGSVPQGDEMPQGCAFGPRCIRMEAVCARPQSLRQIGPKVGTRTGTGTQVAHLVACIRAGSAA